MSKRYYPRMLESKEYESNLNKIRVDRYMMVKEVCLEADISIHLWCGVVNGMISPIYLRGKKIGQIKPWVIRILKVLNCDIEEAFPRYYCKVNSLDNFTRDQISDIIVSEYTNNLSNGNIIDQQEKRWIVEKIMLTLPTRLQIVLKQRFWTGNTLEETGDNFNVSRDRIRQLEAEALRLLRWHNRSLLKNIFI